ncbi:MAG: Asp-tRNA(Asn)/Glu-tRNA(Gln) amidotransferase GatCAB subunit B, partial [Alphaproteobacteria bacterium]|nr:Asp-tRNA(Asn)/Glu-tRNA(Gln) amidotransferase GatCAB subunit B [Alphaproteobacteria bacterium]
LASNWVNNELFGRLNKEGMGINDSPVSAQQLGGLVALIKDGTISGKIAKDVFEILWSEGGDPAQIVEDRGLKQVTDTGAIEAVIDQLIADNPDQAASVKEKPKAMGWFVGQVMKAMQGKANPQAVNQILKDKLGL